MGGSNGARRLAAALWAAGACASAAAADPAELARGKELFTKIQPACAVCHTLQAAGAEGQVGPVLDELKPDAGRVLRALKAGIGVMPSYAERMSEKYAQVNVVALALDMMIELPLKTVLRLIRQWGSFIDDRKDRI